MLIVSGALVAYAPAASADVCPATLDFCIPDCRPLSECCENSYPNPCEALQYRVTNNGDGTYTVYAGVCADAYNCYFETERTVNTAPCANVPAACVGPIDDLCFTYSPDALTNACVTTGTEGKTVGHPTVSVTSKTTCVVGGDVCPTHPWIATGSGGTTVNVPTADGYVEATLACGYGAPCRVTLP